MILFGNINRDLEECRATSGAILVDVREADEFASGHIPGAVNKGKKYKCRVTVKASKQ